MGYLVQDNGSHIEITMYDKNYGNPMPMDYDENMKKMQKDGYNLCNINIINNKKE